MPSKPPRPRDLLPRWQVSIIRNRAEHIATVPAKDETAAIARVVEQYGIADPQRQKRLVARRLD